MRKFLIIIICLFLHFTSFAKYYLSNTICDLRVKGRDIVIKNWTLSGPFVEDIRHNESPIVKQKPDFSVSRKDQKTINYTASYGFIDFSKVFTIQPSNYFLAKSVVFSAAEQDVVLLFGVDYKISIWLNSEFVTSETSKTLTKANFSIKVHLRKGNNNILAKVSSDSEKCAFHLDISSISYAKYYAQGKNFYSFLSSYLIPQNAKMSIAYPYLKYFKEKNSVIELKDGNNRLMLKEYFNNKTPTELDVRNLKDGVYSCNLICGNEVIRQKVVLGDYQKLFTNLLKKGIKYETEKDKINFETLLKRINYLNNFGKKNGFDNEIERKLAYMIYELDRIVGVMANNGNLYHNVGGFHLLGYKSKIDNVTNYLALYAPENYHGEKIPLVIVMPWVARQNPFIESWHLAFTDNIEYLQALGKRYHFAILWASSRIYENYNLNPISSAATFEAFKVACSTYNIDKSRIFLYGTCSGGLQALLFANRYPSIASGVGVEGPEISYIRGAFTNGFFPATWTLKNSILTTASNFKNTPMLILNSQNDWHGAKEPELGVMLLAIRANGGDVTVDSIQNETRNRYIKMVDDNVVTDKIFKYFSTIRPRIPDNLSFSTYQLKYNRCYWITVNDIIKDTVAYVNATCTKKNIIRLQTRNVSSLEINLRKVPHLNLKESVLVYSNSRIFRWTPSSHYLFKINITKISAGGPRKSSLTEGPINDLFARPFIFVKPLNSNKLEIDAFKKNWRSNYFGDCRSKDENSLTAFDIQNYNLIILGQNYKNVLITSILKSLPFKTDHSFVKIDKKYFKGNELQFQFIYPNPLNPMRYVLFIGSNDQHLSSEMFNDLSLKGWNDIEIGNSRTGSNVWSGNFDRGWRIN